MFSLYYDLFDQITDITVHISDLIFILFLAVFSLMEYFQLRLDDLILTTVFARPLRHVTKSHQCIV